MINRDDIEAGDKCYTRDGGCLVARYDGERLKLGTENIGSWGLDGKCSEFYDHLLDIVRIEKAPKPVVEEVWLGLCKIGNSKVLSFSPCDRDEWDTIIKLTIVNGKLEKSEQVK